MLDISCLVKNTTLREELNDLVEYLAYTRGANNLDAGFQSVYNDIIMSGIEVDLQTIAFIYNDKLPKSVGQFDSDHDVNEYALKSFNDAINMAARLEPAEQQERQLGQDNPDIEIVKGLLNMFTKLNTPHTDPIYSDLRQMQEALWKGANRLLDNPKPAPTTQQEWQELLGQALGYEQLGMTDINGRLNGIADLYDAMTEQLGEAIEKLEADGNFAQAQKFTEMVGRLKASTYSLLFSRAEGKNFITSIFKEAGFGKELKNGKSVLDWNKLANSTGSVNDLRNNVQRVMEEQGYPQSVIDGVHDSFANEYHGLQAKIMEWKLKQLDNKSEALGKASNKKTDLKRLAELNNLGIFQTAHDKLLSSVVGISDLQAEDLADLEQLAQAASNMYREIEKDDKYGSGIFASSALQTIQRSIDRIVQRNVNNKTVLMRIMSAIKNFVDILMTGMLMGPLTIGENWLSGVKEIMSPIMSGKSKFINKEDRQVYKSVLMDVLLRGQSYGEEIGSFAPRELYSNSLRFKLKGANVTELAESALYLLMTPARVGLMGFDSANKAVITNKTFKNAMYKALLQNGKTEEQAWQFLNEALHGQSFEDAKTKAEQLLNHINTNLPAKFPITVNNNTIVRLANDLVKANLNSDAAITTEMIEATLKSSYHVAGYGLGHEPNNFLSKMVKGWRDNSVKREQKLRANKDWNGLAWQKFGSTFMNGMILRFIGGATNWVVLRAQSGLGLGIASGFLGQKSNIDIDFKNEDTIKQSIKEREGARNQIGRGMTGITYAIMGYVAMYMLTAGGDDERERKRKRLEALSKIKNPSAPIKDEMKKLKKESTVYQQIRSNYEGNRVFKKMSPDLMLLNYYMGTEKNEELGVLRYVLNTTGIASDYSTASKFADAQQFYFNDEPEMAHGAMTSIAGDRLAVPMWRAYKEWVKLGTWLTGNPVSSDFKNPSNVAEGLMGGGFLEDMGAFNRNSSITILPGIGPKAMERLKPLGIERMKDLKNHPGWENFQYVNDKGNAIFILDKTDRVNAKKAADKWFKENN